MKSNIPNNDPLSPANAAIGMRVWYIFHTHHVRTGFIEKVEPWGRNPDKASFDLRDEEHGDKTWVMEAWGSEAAALAAHLDALLTLARHARRHLKDARAAAREAKRDAAKYGVIQEDRRDERDVMNLLQIGCAAAV